MPFSFIDIEKTKTRKIWLLFIFLVFFYFLSAWTIYLAFRLFFWRGNTADVLFLPFFIFTAFFKTSLKTILIIFGVAFGVGLLHWCNSLFDMSQRILAILKAKAPDKDDAYHKQFLNIVDEVSVAIGGRKIESVVLPLSAMNAFSTVDYHGRAVIGVTEGLLARLNRAQLEAVVAHEAAHVVSNDAFINTVAVCMFGMYGAALEKMRQAMVPQGDWAAPSGFRYRTYGGGRGIGLMPIFLFILIFIINTLGKLIRSFISRACEYRADAVAVRLTRNPYSLAQSLYLISKRWRGEGFGYSYLDSLFIVNPAVNELDEQDGLFADMFSTHPPIAKRIRVLLDMAHVDNKTLEVETEFVKRARSDTITKQQQAAPRWFAFHEGKWQGPFAIPELVTLGFFNNNSFVRREGSSVTTMAYEQPELFQGAQQTHLAQDKHACPRCYAALQKAYYESAPVQICPSCQGVLVENKKIARILLRQEQAFSDEVVRRARTIVQMGQKPYSRKKVTLSDELLCPECQKKMLKQLYSLVYPIEVDKCLFCGVVWFDKDELEILQYLVEQYEGLNSVKE